MASLIIWPQDNTPSIDCNQCGAILIGEPNGNAPLVFDLLQLMAVLAQHECGA